ncbi:hypothetical protein G7Y79_00004g014590 [Physcia stellaris]|nr:hypothetical protein G7Y79_00004g014590 [Physcia stellaris]
MWLLRLAITALSSSTFSHVAAYALSVSHPHIGRDALPNNASDVPDLSQLNANFTSLNDTQFHCSGEEYGSDLSFRSCLDALDHGLGHDTHPLSFGHRDSPGSFDVRLPARVSSADGRTAYTLQIEEIFVDEWTMEEAYNAGAALAQKCVGGGTHARAEGGVVSGLGRNGRMWMELTAYNPHVRCEHPRARTAPRDCEHIYSTMHMSETYEHFVHERSRRTDTMVPWTVWPRIPECGYTVYVAGAEDSESTAHIWEAMVALDDMCARIGKAGTAFGLELDSEHREARCSAAEAYPEAPQDHTLATTGSTAGVIFLNEEGTSTFPLAPSANFTLLSMYPPPTPSSHHEDRPRHRIHRHEPDPRRTAPLTRTKAVRVSCTRSAEPAKPRMHLPGAHPRGLRDRHHRFEDEACEIGSGAQKRGNSPIL